MQLFVCQTCDQIIAHKEAEKVLTSYTTSCPSCQQKNKNK
jgi:DNA replicative helicase MCM subunit Mcm2 (Cdc46/Mcm family)